MNTSTKGAIAELKASAWLLQQGYHVFRNVSAAGPIDLIAWIEPSGETILIDVKTVVKRTNVKRDGSISINLNNGKLKPHQVSKGIRLLGVFEDGSCDWISHETPTIH